MNTNRCTMFKLGMSDPARAVLDPALALLLHEGWEVFAAFPVADDDGQSVMLLLQPPSSTTRQGFIDALDGALLRIETRLTANDEARAARLEMMVEQRKPLQFTDRAGLWFIGFLFGMGVFELLALVLL